MRQHILDLRYIQLWQIFHSKSSINDFEEDRKRAIENREGH